jgi:hypothetical protein
MRTRWLLGVAQLALLATATAHHSPAAEFDLSHRVSVTGVVREFRFTNPHALVFVDVRGTDGVVEHWVATGADPNALRRLGWTGEEFQPGETITLLGNPSRDGSTTLNWQTIAISGERQLAGGNGSFVFPALQARWSRYVAGARAH